jgi:hypothetical protein
LFDFHFAFKLFRYTTPVEQPVMQPAKFCSECGETLKAPRDRFIRGRAICDRCAPRFRARRFLKISSLALLLIIAFAIGRYGTPPRTVYLLGTPIEPIATAEPSAVSAANPSSTSHETSTTNAADEIGQALSAQGKRRRLLLSTPRQVRPEERQPAFAMNPGERLSQSEATRL